MSRLRDHTWRSKYHSDAGSLVTQFYEPALACAVRYDRTSGYFTAGSLTLAARGVENLLRNKGPNHLLRLMQQLKDRTQASDIEQLLRDVKALPTDTKAKHLLEWIKRLREGGYPQVIVFTQYTDTMDFLREWLRKNEIAAMCYSGRGGEVTEPSGAWRTISRDETKRRFREKKADVLLATDAAAEGLNFQFCGALVNYDMPWNPMRVEQRIGRIDRLGQAFEKIRIVNLHYDDTVETDVYRALRERIGLFSSVVGKLQPILAALPRQIADVALKKAGARERDRADLVQQLEGDIKDRQADAFDLDEIALSELDAPARPTPPYDLAALDALLRRPELLPPAMEAKRIAGGEYEMTMPGMKEPLRVTTSRERFEENPGTYELWSPGSPLFPAASAAHPAAAIPGTSLLDLVRELRPPRRE